MGAVLTAAGMGDTLLVGLVVAVMIAVALGPIVLPVTAVAGTWAAYMIGGLVVSEDG